MYRLDLDRDRDGKVSLTTKFCKQAKEDLLYREGFLFSPNLLVGRKESQDEARI